MAGSMKPVKLKDRTPYSMYETNNIMYTIAQILYEL
jgi:hypothetical protein